MGKPLAAMAYFGGKASLVHGTGKWIVEQLGTGEECYAEVCGGMLGVMLQRKPAPKEIANDLDGNVFNWWCVVRERHSELAEMLKWTPDLCRQTLAVGRDGLNDACPVKRAWAFTVVNGMSAAQSGMAASKPNIALIYHEKTNPSRLSVRDRLHLLAERMRDVQMECTDAVALLRRVSNHPSSLSYVDPPYRSVTGAPYQATIDHEDLVDACLAAKGKVAVSGYPGEYPDLEEVTGWHRRDWAAYTGAPTPGHSNKDSRIESLWTNFEPAGQMELGFPL